MGSIIALLALILILGLIIRHVTRNNTLAYWVTLGLIAAETIACWVDASAFEGLLPKVMETLSLFERLHKFVNGVFDMTGIVYYLTVIVFFLFLSVQSLEKRRYN